MSQLPHPWGGFNHFIFFNAHFLSVNVFQGEGGIRGIVRGDKDWDR